MIFCRIFSIICLSAAAVSNPCFPPKEPKNTIKLVNLPKSFFRQPDLEVGKRLHSLRLHSNSSSQYLQSHIIKRPAILRQPRVNPEEIGTYFEGDLLFPTGAPDTETVENSLSLRTMSVTLWPNATLIYLIENEIFSGESLAKIYQAFDTISAKTCVTFQARYDEKSFVNITSSDTGCWSAIGRTGAAQSLNLQSPDCLFEMGTIVHELMHSLGFLHEHTRIDRDEAITVNWDNIITTATRNFEIDKNSTSSTQNIPYDVNSLLHYSEMAFSKNDLPTITPHEPTAKMGQREEMTALDIERINLAYCGSDINEV